MSSGHAAAEPEFSFLVELAAIPASGRSYRIAASLEERARVAERLGLRSVEALGGSFELQPGPAGSVRVTGQVEANVVQTCVVTLVPLPVALTEPVDLRFVAEEDPKAKARHASSGEEEVVVIGSDDPPEIAEGGRIDLGELAVAQLAMALDPYPRASGAAFDPAALGAANAAAAAPNTASPFAVLAKLKARPPS